MEEHWGAVDLNTLKALYEKEQEKLTAALLSGAEWKEVQDQRKNVTELSILLYRRTQSENPAEYYSRSNGRQV